MAIQRTVSPIDGAIIDERPQADERQVAAILAAAKGAQRAWKRRSVAERATYCSAAVDAFVAARERIADELTLQMGRPRAQSPGEVDGFAERARYMISIAEASLAPIVPPPKDGFTRFIERRALGVVLVVAPWNYPYLTAVNAIVPALLAGNAVILKHSGQTPLCAERLADAFAAAELPRGVFQVLHCDHETTLGVVAGPDVDFVSFTGSVPGGHAMQQAASGRFIRVGLELGGKDPAYVRADADVAAAAAGVADGVYYNAGQSCCGVERVYVHRAIFDPFVDAFRAEAEALRLGDPRDAATTIGPMVRASAADFVRGQVDEAIGQGARSLLGRASDLDEPGSPYLSPQLLVDVHHGMRLLFEESFGPVTGILAVDDDAEAIVRMNDSDFGLTASIWTADEGAARRIGAELETGTVFMNRCDVLDPALAWTGVKDSGIGCTLSPLGFEALTRPRSFHLKHEA